MNTIEKQINNKLNALMKSAQLHTEEGPTSTIVNENDLPTIDGNQEWYIQGTNHREDVPAIEMGGTKIWHANKETEIEVADEKEYADLFGKEIDPTVKASIMNFLKVSGHLDKINLKYSIEKPKNDLKTEIKNDIKISK